MRKQWEVISASVFVMFCAGARGRDAGARAHLMTSAHLSSSRVVVLFAVPRVARAGTLYGFGVWSDELKQRMHLTEPQIQNVVIAGGFSYVPAAGLNSRAALTARARSAPAACTSAS